MDLRVPSWVIDDVDDAELGSEVLRNLRGWAPTQVAVDPSITSGQRTVSALDEVVGLVVGEGLESALRLNEPEVIGRAIDAARAVGADEYASALEDAASVVWPAGLPEDPDERWRGWDAFDADPLATAMIRRHDRRAADVDIDGHVARFIRDRHDDFFDDDRPPAEDAEARRRFARFLLEAEQDSDGIRRIRRLLAGAVSQARAAGDDRLAESCAADLAALDEIALFDS